MSDQQVLEGFENDGGQEHYDNPNTNPYIDPAYTFTLTRTTLARNRYNGHSIRIVGRLASFLEVHAPQSIIKRGVDTHKSIVSWSNS